MSRARTLAALNQTALSALVTNETSLTALAGNATNLNAIAPNATALNSVATRSADTKAGTVAFFAQAAAPTGWLACDGTNVSRTTYAALFAAIGTTYGVGDGSTTFALPDLRGEFLRGADVGRGVDTGRVLGSGQNDNLPEHKHQVPIGVPNGNIFMRDTPAFGTGDTFTAQSTNGGNAADSSSRTYVLTDNVRSGSKSGEVRPRNVAMLACIKT